MERPAADRGNRENDSNWAQVSMRRPGVRSVGRGDIGSAPKPAQDGGTGMQAGTDGAVSFARARGSRLAEVARRPGPEPAGLEPAGLEPSGREAAGPVAERSVPEPSTDNWIFPGRWRRLAVIWVGVTAPLAGIAGTFLHGEQQYLVGWVLVSGLYTTPALVVTGLVTRHAPAQDRRFWWMMFAGLVFIYGIGLSMLLLEATGWDALRQGGAVAVSLAMIAYGVGLGVLSRSRSGRRALSVDVVENAIATIAIVSTVPILVGERVIRAEAAWFAIPSALATMAMIVASLWMLTYLVRIGSERTTMEVLGASLAFLGAIQAAVQVAEGVSGFALSQGPVIFLQAICMGLVLLTPSFASRRATIGLDRLPPHAQVRNGGVAIALVTITAIPVVLIETIVLAPTQPWAIMYAGAIAVALLLLSTARHLLTLRETKRLYASVERAADERRLLLARVMQGADHDRHRVAAQLHEQAVASYAAFVSFIHGTTDPREGVPAQIALATAKVRDDLSQQAESLRQLMLAVQPLEVEASASTERLSAPIAAYVDHLYADATPPLVTVEVDADVALDWTTETVVLRIVQEAIRNVCRHSRASHLDVSVVLVDDAVELHVVDDGDGFDPGEVLYESGLAAMRSFAGFTGGTISIDSAPGQGTRLVARLGPGAPIIDEPPPGNVVRLVRR